MTLRALIAASFLVAAGLCRAQGVGFAAGDGLSQDGSLVVYQLNLGARTVTQVGAAGTINNNPVTLLNGLTLGSDGNLYAIASAGPAPLLVTLSRTLGKASLVSQISGVPSNLGSGLSLAFSCDNHLWMASSDSGNFWELTPGTGQTRAIGNLGAKITGLAVRGNVLFGIGGNGDANLYTIATDTGKATPVGPYGNSAPNPVDGAYDSSGTLWGLLRNVSDGGGSGLPSQPNVLGQIDPKSGAMSNLGNIAGPPTSFSFPARLRGLAISPPTACGGGTVDPPPTVGAPALSLWGIGAFVLSLLATVFFVLRKPRFG